MKQSALSHREITWERTQKVKNEAIYNIVNKYTER